MTRNAAFLSSSGPGPGPRSGPGQVPGQVQKVRGLKTKDLDLGYTLNLVCHPPPPENFSWAVNDFKPLLYVFLTCPIDLGIQDDIQDDIQHDIQDDIQDDIWDGTQDYI